MRSGRDWDARRLRRILDNLAANALKYGPEGGEVVVRLGREGAAGEAWADLTVQDRGIGIPADELPRVFEPRFRARNARGRYTGGGLGLFAARLIVEQHGGTIAVASEEGKGTTFTVRLPLAPAG